MPIFLSTNNAYSFNLMQYPYCAAASTVRGIINLLYQPHWEET